jgi:hypothetical protein
MESLQMLLLHFVSMLLMIKPYSPKVKRFGAESTKPQSVYVKDFARTEYFITDNLYIQRYNHDTQGA